VPEPYDAVLLDLYDTIVWSEWFRLRDAIAARIGDEMEAVRLQEAFEQTRSARGVGGFGSVEGDMAAVLRAASVPYDDALVDELVELERAHLANGVHRECGTEEDGAIVLPMVNLEVLAEKPARTG